MPKPLTDNIYTLSSLCSCSAAIILLVFGLHSAFAAPESKNPTSEKSSSNPYDYLNWIPRSDFHQYNDTVLDETPRFCGGAYLPPQDILPDNGTDQSNKVKAFADKVQYWPNKNATFTGHVEVQQKGLKFEAEEVFFDNASGIALVPDKMKMTIDGMLIFGESAEINMSNSSFSLKDIEYVIYRPHTWGSANRVKRKEDITILKKATYTTCEPDERPSWRLRARKIKLNRDTGWGSAMNVWMDIFNIPLLYVPYFRFPIDDERHTGLLFPSISTGEQGGIDFTQPLYINLAPNYDLTLSPRRIPNRGLLWQSEFRYLSESQRGRLELAGLNNDKEITENQVDPAATSSDVDDDRNFASWKHRGSFGQNWRSNISMEYASDEDYFLDFGNSLDISNTTHLLRMLNITHTRQYWTFSGVFQGYQTLDEDIPEENLPYLQLPRAQLNGLIPLNNYLDYILSTEYVYFDRNLNDPIITNIVGHRGNIETGLQINYEPIWGFVKPTVKVRNITYSIEDKNDRGSYSQETTLPIVSLDTGLFFERKFKWGRRGYLQTFDPRLFYLYSPYEDQSSQPNFDTTTLTESYYQLFRERRFIGGDRIGDNNQISIGINSSILGAEDGRERAYFRLGQGFYLDERELQLGTMIPDDSEQSPISGEISIIFSRDWIVQSTFTWDSVHNINEENTLSLIYKPGNGILADAEYRSREIVIDNNFDNRDRRQQSKFSFAMPLHSQWTALGYWYFNLKDQENLPGSTTLETFIGLEYENCCLKARLLNHRYLREQENELEPRQQLLLQLQLKGLANFDDKIAKLIGTSIPYYDQRYQQN